MMCSRRSRTIICLFLCGIITILCLPYFIMKIYDDYFSSFPHKLTSTEYHIETSADDVPYVEHIINIYMTYADFRKETVLISSEGGEVLYRDECIDMAYTELLELADKGVINPIWIKEELQNFIDSNYFSIREYYSENESEGINFSTMMWKWGDKNLRLIYDQKYNKLLEIYYYGGGQIFTTDTAEKLCSSFAAYQGLDILEDWSFNGKRLISPKASLSIEFDQNDNGAGIHIMPTELILLGY